MAHLLAVVLAATEFNNADFFATAVCQDAGAN